VSDVNLQLVREFFELNLFYVLTHWQQDLTSMHAGLGDDRPRGAEAGQSLFVENMQPALTLFDAEFVLRGEDVRCIERAVVEVRAWHADRFYSSVVEANPVLTQFVSADSLSFARQLFGTPNFTTILVISELPASAEPRQRSVQLLQEMGIGHVLEFPALLRTMLNMLSAHGNYASPTLQTLRLLKRYGFIRRQQLEFSFPTEAVSPPSSPHVETVEEPAVREEPLWKDDEEEGV